MPLSIKLPSNNLDNECLRGNGEDYFIKRMKKMESEKLEIGWYSDSRPCHYQPKTQEPEGLA